MRIRTPHIIGLVVAAGLAAAALVVGLTHFYPALMHPAVLDPAGTVARQQRDLILLATGLGLLVVIPVFVLTVAIAWRYRAGNAAAAYAPEHDHSRAAETVWWGVPIVLIAVLGVIIWQSSHRLDPAAGLATRSGQAPLTIQVVALNWKWLFIYPDQQVATVNYVRFPAGRPVNFVITADAPMNSFWIPRLGGQIYAMPGMSTKLSLEADAPGTYAGSSANLSGRGFAGMRFTAQAVSADEFDRWTVLAQGASRQLDNTTYADLARPSENEPAATYSNVEHELYNEIIMKYMGPGGDTHAGMTH